MDGTRTTIATATIKLTTTRSRSSVWVNFGRRVDARRQNAARHNCLCRGNYRWRNCTVERQRIMHKWLGAAWFLPYYLRSSPKLLMHLQDSDSAEAMAFNGGEATTATIAVQGHHTQEGQLSSTSEPYPRCAGSHPHKQLRARRQDLQCQGLPTYWAYFHSRSQAGRW